MMVMKMIMTMMMMMMMVVLTMVMTMMMVGCVANSYLLAPRSHWATNYAIK